MNEFIIDKWVRTVGPKDKVYCLGDVACGYGGDEKKLGDLLGRLPGQKRLIAGNHDNLKSPALHKHFDKIELWYGHGKGDQAFTCSHIPLPLSHLRDGKFCVHGHIHNNIEEDKHYINVCVEHTLYGLIHIEEIHRQMKLVK